MHPLVISPSAGWPWQGPLGKRNGRVVGRKRLWEVSSSATPGFLSLFLSHCHFSRKKNPIPLYLCKSQWREPRTSPKGTDTLLERKTQSQKRVSCLCQRRGDRSGLQRCRARAAPAPTCSLLHHWWGVAGTGKRHVDIFLHGPFMSALSPERSQYDWAAVIAAQAASLAHRLRRMFSTQLATELSPFSVPS